MFKDLLNSKRVRKFLKLFLNDYLSVSNDSNSINITNIQNLDLNSKEIKDIYSILLLLYMKDKYNMINAKYYDYNYPGSYFVTKKYKKELKNKLLEEAEDTLNTIEKNDIYNRYEIIENLYISDIFKDCIVGYKDYAEDAITIYDLLKSNHKYDSDDEYDYLAIDYYIGIIPLKNDNKTYTIGVELETPYTLDGNDDWYALDYKDFYHIITNYKFIPKHDGSIYPGLEFISKPETYSNLINYFTGLRNYLYSKGYKDVIEELDKLSDDRKKYGLHVNISKYDDQLDYEYFENRKSEFVKSIDKNSIKKYFGRNYTRYTDPEKEVNSHYSIFNIKKTSHDKFLVEVRLPGSTYDVDKFQKIIKNSIRVYEYLFGKMTINELMLTLEEL